MKKSLLLLVCLLLPPVCKAAVSPVLLDCPRSAMVKASVTLNSTTAETTLVLAGPSGVYNDLLAIVVNNTSGTAARVDVRSVSGGSVDFPIYVPAGDVRGLTTAHVWPQTTAASAWSIQSSASVSDIRVSAFFCQDRQ